MNFNLFCFKTEWNEGVTTTERKWFKATQVDADLRMVPKVHINHFKGQLIKIQLIKIRRIKIRLIKTRLIKMQLIKIN